MLGTFLSYAAITAVIGLLGLSGTFIVHVVKYGEEKGSMRERIKRLEQEMIEQKELTETVIELKTSITILNNTVGDFKEYIKMIMANPNMTGKK